jgi:hypothetical protein
MKSNNTKSLSKLRLPLSFKDAITDLLQVAPPPKAVKLKVKKRVVRKKKGKAKP